MVVIRLARGGRVKHAIYRIVAADKRRSATSKYLAILGTYNPQVVVLLPMLVPTTLTPRRLG